MSDIAVPSRRVGTSIGNEETEQESFVQIDVKDSLKNYATTTNVNESIRNSVNKMITLNDLRILNTTKWLLVSSIVLVILCLGLGGGMTYCMIKHLYAKDPQPALSYYIISENKATTVHENADIDSITQGLEKGNIWVNFAHRAHSWGSVMRNWFGLLHFLHGIFVLDLCAGCMGFFLLSSKIQENAQIKSVKPFSIRLFAKRHWQEKIFGMNMQLQMWGKTWIFLILLICVMHIFAMKAILEYDLVSSRGLHALATTGSLVSALFLVVLCDIMLQSTMMRCVHSYTIVGKLCSSVRYLLATSGIILSIVYGIVFELHGNVPPLYPDKCPGAIGSSHDWLLLLEAFACWCIVGSLYSFSLDFYFLLLTKGNQFARLTKKDDDPITQYIEEIHSGSLGRTLLNLAAKSLEDRIKVSSNHQ